MTDKELVLTTLKNFGRAEAEALQAKAPDMTPDEVVNSAAYIPAFNPQRQYLDFKPGYVCQSSSGNIVRLIQPYDSLIYQEQPEKLTAQWGFYWSTDPAKAKPFLESATSPYYEGACCTFDGYIWRSKIDNNVYNPVDYPQGWEKLEEVM